MQNRQALFFLAILVFLALPRPAEAQSITSPYDFVDKKKDLGFFVGYIFADRGAAKLGPKAGPVMGAAFNVRVSDPIAVSFIGTFFPAERDVVDPAAEEASQRVVGTADLDLLLLTGRLNLQLTGSRTWHNITPFIYGGLGIAIETGELQLPTGATHPECLLLPRERFDLAPASLGSSGLARSGYRGSGSVYASRPTTAYGSWTRPSGSTMRHPRYSPCLPPATGRTTFS